MNYLYRGVSERMHSDNGGRLITKTQKVFEHCFVAGEGLTCGAGAIVGTSSRNAVIRHQLNQEGFPTSGISTTPHFDRAKFYATKGGEYPTGYVYKIDRALVRANGVQEYIVAEHANFPSIPEDDEVILVASDHGPLPAIIIVEVIVI